MSGKNYVYSTLTAPVNYNTWGQPIPGGLAPKIREVRIEGGANVADRFFRTPKGVVTPVTDEELEHLERNDTFQKHVKDGFIIVEKRKIDTDKLNEKGMKSKDDSAPVTPGDYAHLVDDEKAAVPEVLKKGSKKAG